MHCLHFLRSELRQIPIEKKKKIEPTNVIDVEFKVPMHCDACERTVVKAIFKCKGVEKFITDMKKDRVVVTGRIDPKKVLKKLKKSGKKGEIVAIKDAEEESRDGNSVSDLISAEPSRPYDSHCCGVKSEAFMMFSDENPNACSIM